MALGDRRCIGLGWVLGILLLAPALASAALEGPVATPPLGVSSVLSSTADAVGRTGGLTVTYTAMNPAAYGNLYYGAWPSQVMAGYRQPLDVLTYDVGNSNLPGGIAAFTGTSVLYACTFNPYCSGTYFTRTIRFRMTFTTAYGAPLALTSASTLGLPAGAVLRVTGDFKVKLEAIDWTAGYPLLNEFDSQRTFESNTTYGQTRMSYTGAFWFQSRLAIGDAAQSEGNSGTSPLSFSVTLTPASSQRVDVSYATRDGTAQAGSDYETRTGNLTFLAGVTSQAIQVQIFGDTDTEYDETFRVDLSGATNAIIGDGVGYGTIQTDDAPPPVFITARTKTVASPPFVVKGPVTYTITVVNDGNSAQPNNPGSEIVDVMPSELTEITASATTGTATVAPDGTVDWNGVIPAHGSVTLTIEAKVKPTVPLGTTVTNQATVHFDITADGTNESTLPTDDPALDESDDPTSFVVESPTMDFYTLTPCRAVDTRGPAGPYGQPALLAGAERSFQLFERCEIPLTARALSVNVTVTEPTVSGHIRIYPTGTPRPNTSMLNHVGGQTRANNAVIPLNGLGELTVYLNQASGTAHLLVDVNGYFQ
jgi:uncharacterized repeat protein (TIGR01451 family)